MHDAADSPWHLGRLGAKLLQDRLQAAEPCEIEKDLLLVGDGSRLAVLVPTIKEEL